MRKLLLFFSIIMFTPNAYGMKRQITASERIAKKSKKLSAQIVDTHSVVISSQKLPNDMLDIIFDNAMKLQTQLEFTPNDPQSWIMHTIKPKEAVFDVMRFMFVNKHFYETINSRDNIDKIIAHIADQQRCSHETIERYFNTPYAKKRLDIKRKLKRLCCSRHNSIIMTEKSLKLFCQQDLESTHNHKGVQKTALMMLLSQPELWPLFFAKGANINTPNAHGITLLMLATEYPRWTDVINTILAHPNTNINQQNKKGESALMYALKRKHMAYITSDYILLIIKLLSAGADPELSDKYGCTPHLAACLLGDLRVIQLIEDAISMKNYLS